MGPNMEGMYYMKKDLKEEARRLRKEEGLSLGEIKDRLGVAKSSVSNWVRDIELSDEQKNRLATLNPTLNPILHTSDGKGVRNKYFRLRETYQNQGRVKAKKNNPLHVQGCMLYWAEGAKNKSALHFANSDVSMMKLFVKFLRECYSVEDTSIKITVGVYLDNNLSLDDIEDYWLKELGLNRSNLNRSTIKIHSEGELSHRHNKLVYGTCYLRVNSVKLVQNIFGAIQEYAGTPGYRWIN